MYPCRGPEAKSLTTQRQQDAKHEPKRHASDLVSCFTACLYVVGANLNRVPFSIENFYGTQYY